MPVEEGGSRLVRERGRGAAGRFRSELSTWCGMILLVLGSCGWFHWETVQNDLRAGSEQPRLDDLNDYCQNGKMEKHDT